MNHKNINLLLLMFVPIILGIIAHFVWNTHVSLIAGIIYFILFLFNLPNGSFMSTNSNYQTKRANPNYKIKKQDIRSLDKQKLIPILILVSLIILNFLIYFQQIN